MEKSQSECKQLLNECLSRLIRIKTEYPDVWQEINLISKECTDVSMNDIGRILIKVSDYLES
jgi:hypothetical protein